MRFQAVSHWASHRVLLASQQQFGRALYCHRCGFDSMPHGLSVAGCDRDGRDVETMSSISFAFLSSYFATQLFHLSNALRFL